MAQAGFFEDTSDRLQRLAQTYSRLRRYGVLSIWGSHCASFEFGQGEKGGGGDFEKVRREGEVVDKMTAKRDPGFVDGGLPL